MAAVRWLFKQKGCRITRVTAGDQGGTRPDVRVRALVDGCMLTLGVEVTEYTRSKDESSIAAYWGHVREKAERLRQQHTEMEHIWVSACPRDRSAVPSCSQDALAKELVDLVLREVRSAADARALNSCVNHFGQEHPNTSRCIRELRFWWSDARSVRQWECGTLAGWFGLNWPSVCSAITKKSKRLPRYETGGLDDVWLLVIAPGPLGEGRGIHRSMATVAGPDNAAIRAPTDEVICACAESGFSRVFVGDVAFGWAKQLWPLPAEG